MRINNTDAIFELARAAQLQTGEIVTDLSKTAVATFEMNPKLLRRVTVAYTSTRTSTGTSNLRAATSDREYYIKSLVLGVSGDAATATLACSIYSTINGVATELIGIPQIATAGSIQRDVNIVFDGQGVKIDKGAIVSFQCTFTAGTVRSTASMTGYEVLNDRG